MRPNPTAEKFNDPAYVRAYLEHIVLAYPKYHRVTTKDRLTASAFKKLANILEGR